MYKKIKFFIVNIYKITIMPFISLFLKRDKNILVLGGKKFRREKNKIHYDYFMHSTKYLFLHINNNPECGLKAIYLCEGKEMVEDLRNQGYKDVYYRYSLKGFYYALKAKYWLYDQGRQYVHFPILSAGAVCINLWHGVPLKHIGFDVDEKFKRLLSFENFILKLLHDKHDFYIVNGEYEKQQYKTAFLANDDIIKILGSPRVDSLYHDFKNQYIFIEEDYNNIKKFKDSGKKILIYMPTFRDTGKDISGWLKSDKLKEFLNQNNAVLVCKLHFDDKSLLAYQISDKIYVMHNNSDIYPILKYSDLLITDYSSVAFDYLLLDKPILYYTPDLEEYQKQCREFYTSYSNYAVGDVAQNEDELIPLMQNAVNGVDNYKEQRKALRDKIFVYQDGKNCERLVEWIKNLE